MAGGGVVGIIVPSSILSNSDSIHIATRELILKYFDIIALVELGSGTFGKTGTNTIVLFLTRKDKKPEPAEHYQNRVDDYFEGIKQGDPSVTEYQDFYFIQQYCEHNELPIDEYTKLFGITAETISTIEPLLRTEIFTEYQKDFANSTAIKKLKDKKFFKDKNQKEKELELNKHLINYLYAIEKNKLYYFMLAFENPQKVLIVKSPSSNKEKKKFLGYEWSGAKGNEGIKYSGGSTLNDIITPLFNPNNLQDKTKINTLIKNNFLGDPPNDLSDFQAYKDLISYTNVQDILDFSRKDFNKEFSLSEKVKIHVESKWEIVKLEEACSLITDGTHQTPTYSESGVIFLSSTNVKTKIIDWNNVKYISNDLHLQLSKRCTPRKNDILLAKNGTTGVAAIVDKNIVFDIYVSLALLRVDSTIVLPHYLLNIINTNNVKAQFNSRLKGMGVPNLHLQEIKEVKIPLPPKDIQEKIVTECEAINHEVEQAQQTVNEVRNEIKGIFKGLSININKLKIDDICIVQTGGTPSRKNNEYWNNGTINWLRSEVCQNIILDKSYIFEKITQLGYEKSSTKLLKENTVLIALVGTTIGKVAYLTFNASTNQNIAGLSPKNIKQLNSKFLFYILMNNYDKNFGNRKGKFTMANMSMIKNIQIPVPALLEQKKLVTKVEKLEQKINQAQKIIEKAPEQKQQILDKYLK